MSEPAFLRQSLKKQNLLGVTFETVTHVLLEAVWSLSTQEEAAGRAAGGQDGGPGDGPPGGGVPLPQRGEPCPADCPRGARAPAEEPLRDW